MCTSSSRPSVSISRRSIRKLHSRGSYPRSKWPASSLSNWRHFTIRSLAISLRRISRRRSLRTSLPASWLSDERSSASRALWVCHSLHCRRAALSESILTAWEQMSSSTIVRGLPLGSPCNQHKSVATLLMKSCFAVWHSCCPTPLRELIVADCAPQFLAFELEEGINRPATTAQVEATANHTDCSLHSFRDEHVIELEETSTIGVSMCPAAVTSPLNTRSCVVVTKFKRAKCTETQGAHPVRHLPPTNEQVRCLHVVNTGTCRTFVTRSQTYVQIRSNHDSGGAMRTKKVDDGLLHLFPRRLQIILCDITAMTWKMDRTPDGTEQDNKCAFSTELFHGHHMHIPAAWRQLCPTPTSVKSS